MLQWARPSALLRVVLVVLVLGALAAICGSTGTARAEEEAPRNVCPFSGPPIPRQGELSVCLAVCSDPAPTAAPVSAGDDFDIVLPCLPCSLSGDCESSAGTDPNLPAQGLRLRRMLNGACTRVGRRSPLLEGSHVPTIRSVTGTVNAAVCELRDACTGTHPCADAFSALACCLRPGVYLTLEDAILANFASNATMIAQAAIRELVSYPRSELCPIVEAMAARANCTSLLLPIYAQIEAGKGCQASDRPAGSFISSHFVQVPEQCSRADPRPQPNGARFAALDSTQQAQNSLIVGLTIGLIGGCTVLLILLSAAGVV